MIKQLFLLVLIPMFLFSDAEIIPVSPALASEEPWFTGPLLASSATVVPIGHWGIQPYLNYTSNTARYDDQWKAKKHKALGQLTFIPYGWIGLTQWADFELAPSVSWNHRNGTSYWVVNDLTAKLEFQLYLDPFPHSSWLPSIKLGLQETFPIGRYEQLNPKKEYTDLGGLGSWTSSFQLAFGKLLHVYEEHWIQLLFNVNYSFLSSVDVEGINAYGGGYGTNGRVYPGQIVSFDISCEYNLTRNLAFACDFVGTYQGRGRFSGYLGKNADGTPVINTFKPAIQYSLAPAIEYNWSSSFGLIFGSCFTISGKNSNKFSNTIASLNYYY